MSKIETLVQDIYGLLGSDKEVSKKDINVLADSLAVHITNALKKRDTSRGLRASNLGVSCDRKSWYLHHNLFASPANEEACSW